MQLDKYFSEDDEWSAYHPASLSETQRLSLSGVRIKRGLYDDSLPENFDKWFREYIQWINDDFQIEIESSQYTVEFNLLVKMFAFLKDLFANTESELQDFSNLNTICISLASQFESYTEFLSIRTEFKGFYSFDIFELAIILLSTLLYSKSKEDECITKLIYTILFHETEFHQKNADQ